MLEISSITPSDTNMTAGDNMPVQTGYGVQKNDLEGPDQNVATMSFGDFLDMVNPLQHIPVVSAAYRSITGDKINPVSRIAGDVLYGGILGVASAGIAAVASIGDEVFAANNDGKTMGATIVAGLFGKDDEAAQTTQLADASTESDAAPALASAAVSTPAIQTASLNAPQTSAITTSPPMSQLAFLQTPAKQSAILSPAPLVASASATSPYAATMTARASLSPTQAGQTQPTSAQMAQAQALAASSPISAAAANAASSTSDPVLGMALDRGKPAYGGVMDTSMMQNAMQNQTLALALANGKNKMDAAHAVRNSRFATPVPGTAAASGSIPDTTASSDTSAVPTPAPTAPAASAPTASATPPATTADTGAAPMQTAAQSLMPSLRALKGLDHYRNSAQSMPVTGSSLDVVN